MRNKQYIFYFLFVISMIMVIAPVIPHHHHSDGIICMKDDLKDLECPCQHHQHHQHNDPCCSNDCLTHFESSVPSSLADHIQPHYFHIVTLFTEPLLRLLTQPEEKDIHPHAVYRESLHGTYITRAAGLRAPPALFS